MNVTVKLFAIFRVGRFKIDQRDYPQGVTCREIIDDVGIGEQEIGIILINGRHAALDTLLQEADTLSLFPLVGGG
jgi:sulfur-carrier protein